MEVDSATSSTGVANTSMTSTTINSSSIRGPVLPSLPTSTSSSPSTVSGSTHTQALGILVSTSTTATHNTTTTYNAIVIPHSTSPLTTSTSQLISTMVPTTTGDWHSFTTSADPHLKNIDHISDLERSFCQNFMCCNQQLPDLHALVDHFDQVHVAAPTADSIYHANSRRRPEQPQVQQQQSASPPTQAQLQQLQQQLHQQQAQLRAQALAAGNVFPPHPPQPNQPPYVQPQQQSYALQAHQVLQIQAALANGAISVLPLPHSNPTTSTACNATTTTPAPAVTTVAIPGAITVVSHSATSDAVPATTVPQGEPATSPAADPRVIPGGIVVPQILPIQQEVKDVSDVQLAPAPAMAVNIVDDASPSTPTRPATASPIVNGQSVVRSDVEMPSPSMSSSSAPATPSSTGSSSTPTVTPGSSMDLTPTAPVVAAPVPSHAPKLRVWTPFNPDDNVFASSAKEGNAFDLLDSGYEYDGVSTPLVDGWDVYYRSWSKNSLTSRKDSWLSTTSASTLDDESPPSTPPMFGFSSSSSSASSPWASPSPSSSPILPPFLSDFEKKKKDQDYYRTLGIGSGQGSCYPQDVLMEDYDSYSISHDAFTDIGYDARRKKGSNKKGLSRRDQPLFDSAAFAAAVSNGTSYYRTNAQKAAAAFGGFSPSSEPGTPIDGPGSVQGGVKRSSKKTASSRRERELLASVSRISARARGLGVDSDDSSGSERAMITPAVVVPTPSGGGNGKKREKQFKCPVLGCSKTYLNPNGLKYHIEKGTCTIDPDKLQADIAAEAEADAASVPVSPTTTACNSSAPSVAPSTAPSSAPSPAPMEEEETVIIATPTSCKTSASLTLADSTSSLSNWNGSAVAVAVGPQ